MPNFGVPIIFRFQPLVFRGVHGCKRAIRFSGLGVRSVGPVGDFLDFFILRKCHDPKNDESSSENVQMDMAG